MSEKSELKSQIFLGVTGLAFAGYGVMCLLVPGTLAEAAQFGLSSEIAVAEVRAMYGGLQLAVGVLALLGAVRPALEKTALVSLCFVFAGLAGGRLFAIVLASDPGAYNYAAFGYEAVSVLIAIALVRASPKTA
jgi:hypothetical protein